jgi:AAA domain
VSNENSGFDVPKEGKELLEARGVKLPDIITLDSFLAQEIPEPPQLIKGILHQGSKGVIGGGSKSYKTWLLTDLAISVAAGAPWLEFPTHRGKVLYANLELQAFAYQRRLITIAEAKGLDPQGEWQKNFSIWNLRGHNKNAGGLINELMNRCTEGDFSLIVLDPLYKLLGGRSENAAEDMNDLFNNLEGVANSTGAAVVFGSHFSKGNQAAKESIDRISGSGVFARDPDTIIIVTSHEVESAYSVEMTLRNLPPAAPFVMRWNHPLFVRDAGLNPDQLKKPKGPEKKFKPPLVRQVLNGESSSKKELVERLKDEYGMSKTKAYDLILEAESSKIIQKNEDGRLQATPGVTNVSSIKLE